MFLKGGNLCDTFHVWEIWLWTQPAFTIYNESSQLMKIDDKLLRRAYIAVLSKHMRVLHSWMIFDQVVFLEFEEIVLNFVDRKRMVVTPVEVPHFICHQRNRSSRALPGIVYSAQYPKFSCKIIITRTHWTMYGIEIGF